MWGATYISYPFQKTLLVQPMFKNYVGKHPLQNRTNVQIKGGGSKAFWTMFKKTALFSRDGFPYSGNARKNTFLLPLMSSLKWKHQNHTHSLVFKSFRLVRPPRHIFEPPPPWSPKDIFQGVVLKYEASVSIEFIGVKCEIQTGLVKCIVQGPWKAVLESTSINIWHRG